MRYCKDPCEGFGRTVCCLCCGFRGICDDRRCLDAEYCGGGLDEPPEGGISDMGA